MAPWWSPPAGRVLLLAIWIGLLAGCAGWPEPTRSPHVGQAGAVGSCADFFARLDRRTVDADAVDAAYSRVAGYPYARTDRFLASFGDAVDGEGAFAAWVDRLQALDRSARRVEIANLPDRALADAGVAGSREDVLRTLMVCGERLKAEDVADTDARERLRRAVVARDDYLPLRRALGVYPITGRFVSRGVARWHAEARESFSNTAPSGWQAIRYGCPVDPDPDAARTIVERADRDALGIPVYATAMRDRLFAAYAPIWEVDTRSAADRIGSPHWGPDDRIGVDTNAPAVYLHLSFTRFQGFVLTQLNYVIWFPSRPKSGVLDIYAGRLDGLNYRVTLDTSGDPILYETIHNCGCYYQAYPSDRLRVRPSPGYAESPLILPAPPIDPAAQAMVVSLQNRTHFVQHLYSLPRASLSGTIALAEKDYAALQQLPRADGSTRSMFDRFGLVAGTERLERYLLWPSGVLSPGAMRQWGRHAVAFVGERHFDDPFFMDRMFDVVPTSNASTPPPTASDPAQPR